MKKLILITVLTIFWMLIQAQVELKVIDIEEVFEDDKITSTTNSTFERVIIDNQNIRSYLGNDYWLKSTNKSISLEYMSNPICNLYFKTITQENTINEKSVYLIDSTYDYDWVYELDNWGEHTKSIYNYDAYGNRTLRINYNWVAELNKWVVSGKSLYYYDANGNKTESIFYNWDSELNEWIESSKWINIYDDDENRTEWIWYSWDSELNEWIGNRRWIFSHDTNGISTGTTTYDWNISINEWVGDWKVEQYYIDGINTKMLGYLWDPEISDWMIDRKNTFAYDSNGNLIEDVYYYWVPDLNNWIKVQKNTWFHDANGNTIEEIIYDWDTDLTDWIENRKRVIMYNSNGYKIESIDYDWDTEYNNWVNKRKKEYTNDELGNLLEEVYYSWNTLIHEWDPLFKYVNYWSLFIGMDENYEMESLNVYPNPVIDNLIIKGEFNSIQIYTLNGMLIQTRKSNGIYNELNLSLYKPGIYFIKLINEHGLTVKKIIKK